jgi:hypothetical protein
VYPVEPWAPVAPVKLAVPGKPCGPVVPVGPKIPFRLMFARVVVAHEPINPNRSTNVIAPVVESYKDTVALKLLL